jgi:GT2 family glycosyltransferase
VICAVIVTRDRLELLQQCLDALAAQTRAPDRVLVVDNASSDGTREWLAGRDVDVLRLEENAGGAGGFHAGLREAVASGAEWAWLMDDDTIPRPDALAELAGADAPGTLLRASVAVWRDGRLHPMNVPGFERDDVAPLVDGAARRVLPLRTATFVSLLVHREAVERFGLPDASYFIWADDLEYTARVTRGGGGAALVPASVVEHRTREPHTAVTATGGRFYFHVRNTLYMVRGRSWSALEKVTLLYLLAVTSAQYLAGGGAPLTVLRGLRDGLRRRRARTAA